MRGFIVSTSRGARRTCRLAMGSQLRTLFAGIATQIAALLLSGPCATHADAVRPDLSAEHRAIGGDQPRRTLSRLESLKLFLSHPPIIEELVVRKKLERIVNHKTTEKRLEGSTNYQTYIIRWQPDAYSLYAVSSPLTYATPVINDVSFSSYGRKTWQLSPNGTLIYWLEQQFDVTPAVEYNYPQSTLVRSRYYISEILNLGIYGIDAGAAHWAGNRLTAMQSEFKLPVEGELMATNSGTPFLLQLRYYSETNRAHNFIVYYNYDDTNCQSYLPRHVRRVQSIGGTNVERFSMDILSVKPADAVFSEGAFLPRTGYVKLPTVFRVYTNGHYYKTNSSGALVLSAIDPTKKPAVEHGRVYYFAGCALFSIAIFILMTRARSNR